MDYDENIKIIMHNKTEAPFAFEADARIAQMVFIPFVLPFLANENTDNIPTKSRQGGIGSTGIY